VYPAKEPNLISDLIVFVAQGFGVGHIRFAPGLFGSLLGAGWFLMVLAAENFWFYLGGTLGGLAASVWFCGAAQKILKQKDLPSVVLDQIAAVPVCFLGWIARDWFYRGHASLPGDFGSGGNWVSALLIFVLFRFFHVVKPWPVRHSQHLPGGWRITADDVLAAIFVAALSLLFLN
jgi:phosphatidylglycerophosphatase A